jgi:guanylate kinase
MENRGKLFIISSPSGGGKDAVIRQLVKIFPKSKKLVTTTTRQKRVEDVDGVTYHFIDKKEFEDKIKNNEILEHNIYAGNYYGIEKKNLENDLAHFDLVFTNIDIHGRRNLSAKKTSHTSIFILPDNLEAVRQRLARRPNAKAGDIEARIKAAEEEIKASSEYDYIVTNIDGKLSETVENTAKLIKKTLNNDGGLDKKTKIG